MNVNLINVGQLLQNKYDLQFFYTYCAIYDKPPSRRLTTKIEMTKNRIFPFNLKSANLTHSVAHNRFGYLHFKSLNLLHKQSMVKGLLVINEQSNSCEDCIIGEHQRKSFTMSTS